MRKRGARLKRLKRKDYDKRQKLRESDLSRKPLK